MERDTDSKEILQRKCILMKPWVSEDNEERKWDHIFLGKVIASVKPWGFPGSSGGAGMMA